MLGFRGVRLVLGKTSCTRKTLIWGLLTSANQSKLELLGLI